MKKVPTVEMVELLMPGSGIGLVWSWIQFRTHPFLGGNIEAWRKRRESSFDHVSG